MIFIKKSLIKKELQSANDRSRTDFMLATARNDYSDLNSYVIAVMQLVIYLLIFNNPVQ